jgi:hypothetical protein
MDELGGLAPSPAGGSSKKLWRNASLAVALAGTLASVGMIAPAGASAACPTPPPGTLLFHGALTEGVAKIGKNAESRNINGTVKCGELSFATFKYNIAPENVTFEPGSLTLFHLLSLPAQVKVEAPVEGQLRAVAAEEFETTQTLPVSATVKLLIFTCKVSFTPVLTTEKSGSLEGKPLQGNPSVSLKGELVANEFEVPKIQPSSSCPSFVAGLSNFLLGLPSKAGGSSLTTMVSLEAGE